jgi:hypothetical protein
MINSVLEKLSPTKKADATKKEADAQAAKAKKEEPAKVDKEKLHAKEIEAPKFKKIEAGDKDLEKEVQAILKRYKTGSDKYHGAAISEDGKSLVVSHDGTTTLKENFGGSTGLARFANKIFKIFSKVDRAVATAKYQEFFNNYDPENKDVSMVHEPIKHLYKGLSSNHYHGVSIFHKDEKTGKFLKTPSAVSIIDSYKFIYDEHKKNNDVPADWKDNVEMFDDGYALDKTIPIDMEKAKDFNVIYRELAEGLYAAQGFSFLTIPGQVNKTLNSSSKELNYVEMPWHRVHQKADKSWRVMANKKKFDPEMIDDEKDRKLYESRIDDSEFSNITIVRPVDQAEKYVEPFIGSLENWSQMYSGNTLRANKKDDQKVVDLARGICEKYIETYNADFLGPV